MAADDCVICGALVYLFSNFALFNHAARQFGFGVSKDLPLLFRSSWLAAKSASLWALAAFAFVRYGFRDRSSWLGAVYAGLCVLYLYALGMPSLRTEVYVGCVVVALFSLSASGLRRSSVVVAISLVSWNAASLIFVLFSLTNTGRHFIGHVLVVVIEDAVPLVLAALTFSSLHRRLIEASPSPASQRETQSIL